MSNTFLTKRDSENPDAYFVIERASAKASRAAGGTFATKEAFAEFLANHGAPVPELEPGQWETIYVGDEEEDK